MTPASAAPVAWLLLLVAATFVLGARYGKRVGIAAVILTASGLVELFRLSYPASELPADALLMLSLAAATGTSRRDPLVAGLLAAAAMLLRPAGAAIALLITLFLLFRPERRWPARARAALLFSTVCVAGLVLANVLPGTAPAAGGVGGALVLLGAGISFLLFLILFLAAPFVIPGMLTALLMLAAIVDLGTRVMATAATFAMLPSFTVVALSAVVAMASFDAIWRRTHLPRADVAVAAAAAVLVALVHL